MKPADVPDLHDGSLIGIEIDANDIIASFRTVNGKPVELRFRSVHYFKCDDFREGNIVLDLEISHAGDIEPKSLGAWLHGNPTASELKALISKVKSSNWKCVMINPSYGAEVTCICENVEVADH